MQIEIVKAERSSKNEKIVIITGKTGTYAGFAADLDGKPTGLADLKAGDIIEAEIMVKGEFKNIKSFSKFVQLYQPKPAQANPIKPAPAPTPTPPSGPEHGMAMKLIGDLYIAGQLELTHPLVVKVFAELNRIMGTKK